MEIKRQRKAEGADGILYSYRLLLSWMIEKPELYGQVKQWITPEDFVESTYQEVAKALFEQMEQGEVIPAKIINRFEEVEEQNLVAAMFQTNFSQEMDRDERQKAITDLIIKIKKHSIDIQAGQATDIGTLQKLTSQKKTLQNKVKVHIS